MLRFNVYRYLLTHFTEKLQDYRQNVCNDSSDEDDDEDDEDDCTRRHSSTDTHTPAPLWGVGSNHTPEDSTSPVVSSTTPSVSTTNAHTVRVRSGSSVTGGQVRVVMCEACDAPLAREAGDFTYIHIMIIVAVCECESE
jgi:hypothetical protein